MDTSQYKCPNCSAELVFDPTQQNLKCEFCRSTFTMEKIKEIYNDIKPETSAEIEKKHDFEENTNLYICGNCGAQIMTENDTTATFCYYCHSPVILSGKLTGEFIPSQIIGFHLKRETAITMFQNWCKNKKFIPKDFRSQQQLEKLTGLYVPFWVADCDITADYHAIGKTMRFWTSGNYDYTETKEYSIERLAKIHTIGIPADGESKIDDLLMESIEPFDYKDLKPFDMSYFSGFFADKYDVDKAAVFPRIRERAEQAGRNVIANSVSGYNSTAVTSQSYSVDHTNWKYIMLPVWFMTYRYNDKLYEFAINGQTGKLAGTPPLDKKKLLFVSALIGLIVTLIVFIGGQLLL